MKTIIRTAEIINPDQRDGIADVVIEFGKIIGVYKSFDHPSPDDQVIDAGGNYLCPGMIDVHFHGAAGADTMDADLPSFHTLSRYCAEHGVTSVYLTTWAAPHDVILDVLQAVKSLPGQMPGAQILGVHLEGPYLNVDFKGAQAGNMLAIPREEEYNAWFDSGVVKLVTCAPELPGANDFITAAIRRDVRVSIGHSAASYEQVLEVAEGGVTQATHLFNGMRGIHHREPGTAGGVLDESRLFAQVICDGIHLHPAILRLAYTVKTNKKMILITDSIVGAGLEDGGYDNNGNEIFINDGIARTRYGSLAGSTLTMEKAISNMMVFTGEPLEKVIPMATSTPAEAMGMGDRKGRIEAGYDADLVLFNKELHVDRTFVGGKVAFQRS